MNRSAGGRGSAPLPALLLRHSGTLLSWRGGSVAASAFSHQKRGQGGWRKARGGPASQRSKVPRNLTLIKVERSLQYYCRRFYCSEI